MNLTWQTVFYEYETLVVQLYFFEPAYISPQLRQDKIAFFVRDEGMPLFKSLFLQEHLIEKHRLMTTKVKRQFEETEAVANYKSLTKAVGSGLMALLLLSFIFSFLFFGAIEYILCLIRYM